MKEFWVKPGWKRFYNKGTKTKQQKIKKLKNHFVRNLLLQTWYLQIDKTNKSNLEHWKLRLWKSNRKQQQQQQLWNHFLEHINPQQWKI